MDRHYTVEEVKEHSNAKSCWIIIRDGVYDVTYFLKNHPGGPNILLEHAGTDVTTMFRWFAHSKNARAMMEKYKIGKLMEDEIK